MPSGFSSGVYYGFNLKKDHFYGRDRGDPITYTSFHDGDILFIYRLIGEKWVKEPISYEKLLSLLSPQPN